MKNILIHGGFWSAAVSDATLFALKEVSSRLHQRGRQSIVRLLIADSHRDSSSRSTVLRWVVQYLKTGRMRDSLLKRGDARSMKTNSCSIDGSALVKVGDAASIIKLRHGRGGRPLRRKQCYPEAEVHEG